MSSKNKLSVRIRLPVLGVPSGSHIPDPLWRDDGAVLQKQPGIIVEPSVFRGNTEG
jgi:hypothetical protein